MPIQNAQRAARSGSPLVQMEPMCALQAGHVVVVAAEHVGRRRQQLEVLRVQRRHPVRVSEPLVRVAPRPPRVRLAALVKRFLLRHLGCALSHPERLSDAGDRQSRGSIGGRFSG